MLRAVATFLAMAFVAVCSFAGAQTDPRYCGAPKRDGSGKILRSKAEIRSFKSIHACPSTGRRSGPCPGWAVDHVIPLACGGCDSVVNMQWLPDQAKSASGPSAKDRFERKIYCKP